MSAHRCSVANLEALARGSDFKSSNGNINWKLTRNHVAFIVQKEVKRDTFEFSNG